MWSQVLIHTIGLPEIEGTLVPLGYWRSAPHVSQPHSVEFNTAVRQKQTTHSKATNSLSQEEVTTNEKLWGVMEIYSHSQKLMHIEDRKKTLCNRVGGGGGSVPDICGGRGMGQ